MNVKITKHFNYSTPFSEANNDQELEHILRLKYPKACGNLEVDAAFFARMVREVQEYKAWRVMGFKSFEDFCREKLGKTMEEVEQIMRGVRFLQAQGKTEISRKAAVAADIAAGKMAGQGTRTDLEPPDIVRKSDYGNQRDYLAARIKRDHPDILARAEAGEFKSMRAAAIAAGIVKVKSPLEQVEHWWDKMSETERKSFLERHGYA